MNINHNIFLLSSNNSISYNNSDNEDNENNEFLQPISYRKSINSNKFPNFLLTKEIKEKENKIKEIYDHALIAFNEKKYETIISTISHNEKLFFKNSESSFNMLKMKIRSKLKLLKIMFEPIYFGKNKIKHTYKIEKELLYIQKDFDKLMEINDNNLDKQQEEICNQIYCHMLFYYATLWKIRNDYVKSLSYISLALNLLKIYFLKYGKANEIGTYSIYCKIYLFFIYLLILDNNIDLAIFYEDNLFNLINVSLKIVKEHEKQIYNKKFYNYLFINFLFFGFCFEYIGKPIESMNSYKFAYDLLKNESFLSDEKYFELIVSLYYQISLKVHNKTEKNIKEIEIQSNNKEKKEQLLSLIANGYTINPNKFKKVENNIANNILSPFITDKINNLDKELEILVYTNRDFNKELNTKQKKNISPETKDNLRNYKIYSTLLTKDYTDLILKNNLYLNDPEAERETIERINSYLYHKMTITNNNIEQNSSKKNINNRPFTTRKFNFKRVKSENILTIKDNLNNNIENKRKKTKRKNINKNKSSNNLFSITRPLSNDFEKRNKSGRTLSKNYFSKYMKLEKYTNQELDFQKTLLNIRSRQSKYYFVQNSKDMIFNKDSSKKKAFKSYFLIKNNLSKKVIKHSSSSKNQITEISPEKLYNKLFHRRNRNLMTTSFNKVFKNYQKKTLIDRKEQEKCDDINYIKLRNEKNIIKLNGQINYISQILEDKKKEFKKNKKINK